MAGLYYASKIKSKVIPDCGVKEYYATLYTYFSEEGRQAQFRVSSIHEDQVIKMADIWDHGTKEQRELIELTMDVCERSFEDHGPEE